MLTRSSCVFLSWELYYGIVIPSNRFEHVAFFGWFIADACYTCVALAYGLQGRRRTQAAIYVLVVNVVALALHVFFAAFYSHLADHHATAWYTGLIYDNILVWGCTFELKRSRSAMGQSLESWSVLDLSRDHDH